MKKMPTRLRRNNAIRQMAKETRLSMDQVIYPVFLVEGQAVKEEIPSLPDQFHYSIDRLVADLPLLMEKGIGSLLLFASTDHKSIDGSSGCDAGGLVQEAIRAIKASQPAMYVIADVCLCQYKEDGHCCIYTEAMEIDHSRSLDMLCRIALSYAEAGVDMVAPSDMMDGRVGAIRETLDEAGFSQVAIMAYSAKYASTFYGPFREAAHSAPAFGDRRAYQMDPANRREALREIRLDLEEGADIVMVKPAMAYLDIIADAARIADVPVAAYQVSGEYALLVNGIKEGILDERAIYESLIAIRRSGADLVITYFAKDISRILEKEARR